MLRQAAVLAIALSACAPQAHSPTFQAVPEPPRVAEKHHTHISKGGAAGLAILGAAIVGFAGVAIFAVPRTGSAG
jgi:hypothetical protein